MRTIPLYNRANEVVAYTKVDDEDYERLAHLRWHLNDGYARTSIKGCKFKMHRLILDTSAVQIDHINLDKLDNCKANLRPATRSQNLRNRPKQANNTSGYKGVSKIRNKWEAQIRVDGERRHLGYYDTPKEAAHAYDTAAQHFHGDFAQTNF